MKIVRLARVVALTVLLGGLVSVAAPAVSPATRPHAEVTRTYFGAAPLHGHDVAGFKPRAGGTKIAVQQP